ncbi:MAG TPA: hypothetical protein VF518_06055, partial [Polyangia bacterium]
MTRQTLLLVLALGWAGFARAAVPDAEEGDDSKKIGLLGVETSGLAPQLAKRLHGTVLDALKVAGLQGQDLTDSQPFLARCDFLTECLTAMRSKLNLDYVLLAKVGLLADSSPSKPEHQIQVRLGRMPSGLSAWGPWTMTTTCLDCSDTELTDAMRQLVTRTWKAMQKAELPAEAIEISSQDRRTKGAKLVKRAADERLSVFEQVYLLKKAIHAGAGGVADLQLAWIFFRCHGYEEAEDHAVRAAASGANVDKLLGPMLLIMGRWEEALPVIQRLLRDSAGDKRWQEVLDEIDRRGRDRGGLLAQAETELKTGEAWQAARLARIALASGKGIWARHILAKTYLKMNNYAD